MNSGRATASVFPVPPLVASANPVLLHRSSLLAFGMIMFWSFAVEAGLVVLLLAFQGAAPLRVFLAYFVGNAAVFFFVFQPLLMRSRSPPVLALEVMVVFIDGLVLKLLVTFDAFQGDAYRGVSWTRSTAISGIGNGLSYFIGYVATQRPWEMH